MLEGLYRHHATLRGYFRRRGALDECEDLAQETYLRLLRATRDGSAPIANTEAYLFTIARNLAREHAVRRQREPVAAVDVHDLPDDLAPSTEAPAEQQMHDAQNSRELAAAIESLPDRTRAVLVMQYRDGMSYQQIGQRMGISVHMVKKHVVRALAHCRRVMKRQDPA